MNNLAMVQFYSNSGDASIEWAALYEGEYTVETLPPYVSKGYGAELAECQRYFLYNKSPVVSTSPAICGIGTASNATSALIQYPTPVQMREGVNPTVTCGGTVMLLNASNSSYMGVSSITPYNVQGRNIIWLSVATSGCSTGGVYSLALQNGTGWIAISKDL